MEWRQLKQRDWHPKPEHELFIGNKCVGRIIYFNSASGVVCCAKSLFASLRVDSLDTAKKWCEETVMSELHFLFDVLEIEDANKV